MYSLVALVVSPVSLLSANEILYTNNSSTCWSTITCTYQHTHTHTHTLYNVHVIPVSFHPPAEELVDEADVQHCSCSPLLDPSSSHLIISPGTSSPSLLPPLLSPPSTDELLSGLEERNSYVCSPPVPLSVCVSVTKAAVSYCWLLHGHTQQYIVSTHTILLW